MADYGKLLSRIWSDSEFVELDAQAQQLYCLLISYSTRNLAGVLPLTLKRWANATKGATVESVTDAMQRLAERRFVVVDWNTEEVLVRTYIRNDEVWKQPNLLRSARKSALQVESGAIRWALHRELRRLPDHKEADKANPCVICLERTIPLTNEVITAAGLVEERVIDGKVMWRDDDDTCPTGVGRWIRAARVPTDPGYYRYVQNNWKHDADD